MHKNLEHSGRGTKRRMAARRLNCLGEINAFAEHANSKEKIEALES